MAGRKTAFINRITLTRLVRPRRRPYQCYESRQPHGMATMGHSVSADKIAFYTLRNAMETCLIVDQGDPARHAGGTGGISLKNSMGNSSRFYTEPPPSLPLPLVSSLTRVVNRLSESSLS
jgi:hypothetical protein